MRIPLSFLYNLLYNLALRKNVQKKYMRKKKHEGTNKRKKVRLYLTNSFYIIMETVKQQCLGWHGKTD